MSTSWSAPGQPPPPEPEAPPSPWSAGASDQASGGTASPRRPGGAPPGGGPLQRELVARVPMFPLRPMGLGEVLGAAVRIYRVRPRLVLGLSAVVFGIAFVLTSLFQGAGMIPTMTQLQVLSDPAADPTATGVDFSPAELYAMILSSVAAGLVSLVATQLVTLVLARITIDEAVGTAPTQAGMRALLRRRGVAAVVLGLLTALVSAIPMVLVPILAGLPLLIVQEARWWTIAPFVLGILVGLLGTMYVAFRLLLAVPALAVEQIGPIGALRRSLALTRGRRSLRVLGIGVLVYLLYLAAQQALAGVLGTIAAIVYFAILLATDFAAIVPAMIIMMVISMLGAYLAIILTAPFLSAGITALYADARMRHEAWDVELHAIAAEASWEGSAA